MLGTTEEKWIVFLDANVMFKANVFRFIIGGALADYYMLRSSEKTIQEARDALGRKNRPNALVALENNIKLIPDFVVRDQDRRVLEYSRVLESSLIGTEQKDRHVLVGAIQAKAKYLVTDNLSDFNISEVQSYGLEVIGIDNFGIKIASTQRGLIALSKYIQLTPPDRLKKYLESLKKEIPQTMELILPFFSH